MTRRRSLESRRREPGQYVPRVPVAWRRHGALDVEQEELEPWVKT